jgi:hypothetical protein
MGGVLEGYQWEVTVASGWDSRKEDRRLFHCRAGEWAISAVTLRTFYVVIVAVGVLNLETREQDESKDKAETVTALTRSAIMIVFSISASPKPLATCDQAAIG